MSCVSRKVVDSKEEKKQLVKKKKHIVREKIKAGRGVEALDQTIATGNASNRDRYRHWTREGKRRRNGRRRSHGSLPLMRTRFGRPFPLTSGRASCPVRIRYRPSLRMARAQKNEHSSPLFFHSNRKRRDSDSVYPTQARSDPNEKMEPPEER